MCLAIQIKCKHKFVFLVKIFETCKLSDGYGVLLLQHVNYVTPHILKQNIINKVVKVVAECSNWPNIHVIYKNIYIPTDMYVYKSYQGPL